MRRMLIPALFLFVISGLIHTGISAYSIGLSSTQFSDSIIYQNGHSYFVLSLAADKVTGKIYSGAGDMTIKEWDNNMLSRTFTGHRGPVTKMIIDHSRGVLISASIDMTIRIWDIDSGECVGILIGHRYGVYSLAMDNNGYLYSGDQSGVIIKWDIEAEDQLLTREIHTDTVYDLAVNNEDNLLYSGSKDGKLISIDTQTFVIREEILSTTRMIFCIAYNPDTSEIVAGLHNGAIVAFNKSGEHVFTQTSAHLSGIYTLSISPDGTKFISSGGDGIVNVWDSHTHENIRKIICHTYAVYDTVYTSNNMIATGSLDRTIKLWNIDNGSWLDTFPSSFDEIRGIKTTNDNEVYVWTERSIILWDIENLESSAILNIENKEIFDLIAVDGKIIALGGSWIDNLSKCIIIMDRNLNILHIIEDIPQKSFNLEHVNSNEHVVSAIASNGEIFNYNFNNYQECSRVSTGFSSVSKAKSNKNGLIALFREENNTENLNIWDFNQRRVIYSYPVSSADPVADFEFVENNTFLVLLSSGTVKLINFTSGEVLMQNNSIANVKGLFLDKELNCFAVCDDSGNTLIFTLDDLGPLKMIRNGSSIVSGCFFYDQAGLFLAGENRLVRFYPVIEMGRGITMIHRGNSALVIQSSGRCFGINPMEESSLAGFMRGNFIYPIEQLSYINPDTEDFELYSAIPDEGFEGVINPAVSVSPVMVLSDDQYIITGENPLHFPVQMLNPLEEPVNLTIDIYLNNQIINRLDYLMSSSRYNSTHLVNIPFPESGQYSVRFIAQSVSGALSNEEIRTIMFETEVVNIEFLPEDNLRISQIGEYNQNGIGNISIRNNDSSSCIFYATIYNPFSQIQEMGIGPVNLAPNSQSMLSIPAILSERTFSESPEDSQQLILYYRIIDNNGNVRTGAISRDFRLSYN